MIAIHIQEIGRAESGQSEGLFWVTLRFNDSDRVVICARSQDHADAIAAAINGGAADATLSGS